MKKFAKKTLSIALALVMCAGMVAPAFAAVAFDKDVHVDKDTGWLKSHTEDDKESYDYYLDKDITLDKTLVVGGGVNASIDLNGYKLQLNDSNEVQRDEDGYITGVTAADSSGSVKNGSVIEIKALDPNGNGPTTTLTVKDTDEYGGNNRQTGAITGGNTFQGGGIYVSGNSKLIMTGGKITGNYAGGGGGGIFATNTATIDLSNMEISENAGMGSSGGLHLANNYEAVTMSLKNVRITDNFTQGTGAGLYMTAVKSGQKFGELTVNMEDCYVGRNVAKGNGGGMAVYHGSVMNFVNGAFEDNHCNGNGGAVHVVSIRGTADTRVPSIFKATGTTMTKNRAGQNGSGGAINAFNGDIQLDSVTITDNTAGKNGGGIHLGEAARDFDKITEQSSATFNGTNTIYDNIANDELSDIYAVEGAKVTSGWNFSDWAIGGKWEDGSELESAQNLVFRIPTTPDEGGGSGVILPDPIVADVDDPGVEIDDPAVPLAAGPVTRAEFIDYLWRHEGEPASDGVCTFTDVPEDHEYVLALAWAEQNKVAFAYDDGAFEPDELITVGAAREFLGNFAKVFGTNAVAAADLKSLTGADDEAVLNCDEVLAEFFGA